MKYLQLSILFFSLSVHAQQWDSVENFSRLLHYQNNNSLVKDNNFFLHEDGKNNIALELEALIESYNSPILLGEKHPRCIFPDRYFWLSKQIYLDKYEVYPTFCNKLKKWHDDNPVKSVSALFVGGYFSNPASFFGHNLLRFNGGDNELFDLTLNFGAKVPEDETALSYIGKGLFGGYDARFSNQEFYKRDLVYSKSELRDIWDYELKLSEEELTLLKLHIWTIRNRLFDYYFLKENCAYQIASILNIVIDMDLPKYKQWYMPVDLTNQLSKHSDRVKSVTYQPSIEKKIFKQFANLNEEELDYAEQIIKTNYIYEHHNKEVEINVLNTLLSYYNTLLIDSHDEEMAQKRDMLLARRLELPIGEKSITIKNVAPHNYPSLSKASLYFDKNNIYSEFSIFNNSLLGEHGLQDAELIASRVKFVTNKEGKTDFYDLDIIKIIKLNRSLENFPQQKISWEAQLGIKRIDGRIKPTAIVGIGKTIFSDKKNVLYSMASALVNHTHESLSPQVKLNLLSKNSIGNFLISYKLDIKNKNNFLSFNWKRQINNSISLSFDRAQKNSTFGVGFHF